MRLTLMVNAFFRSIGFRNLKKNEDLWQLLGQAVTLPDEEKLVEDSDGNEFAAFRKYLTDDIGICVCGYFVNDTEFRMEYYYPFFEGKSVSTTEPIDIERHASKEAYAGVCDDYKLGITLIFYVDNIAEVLQKKKVYGTGLETRGAVLSGLAGEGKILLPVAKPAARVPGKPDEQAKKARLMRQAHDGDQAAIDSLTAGDVNTYSELSKRVEHEDILSIVETSMIPYGIDSDEYIVLGEIMSCRQEQNPISGETLWFLQLQTNNIEFDVCINAADLVGVPEPGRRFRGKIWLQGRILIN